MELFDAETMKKESVPNLRICQFLRSEVSNVDHFCRERGVSLGTSLVTGEGGGLPGTVAGL